MRLAFALVGVLVLSGCTDADWSRLTTFDEPVASFPEPAVVPVVDSIRAAAPLPPNSRCQTVASERSNDVQTQGFDDNTQRDVYNATYADCIAWAARAMRTR